LIQKEKKRFSGGYLSLRQVLYLALGLLPIGLFFLHIPKAIAIILSSFVSVSAVLFAFYKIKDIRADTYFALFVKYLTCKKMYRYKG